MPPPLRFFTKTLSDSKEANYLLGKIGVYYMFVYKSEQHNLLLISLVRAESSQKIKPSAMTPIL
jgi:hypothetical protein